MAIATVATIPLLVGPKVVGAERCVRFETGEVAVSRRTFDQILLRYE